MSRNDIIRVFFRISSHSTVKENVLCSEYMQLEKGVMCISDENIFFMNMK